MTVHFLSKPEAVRASDVTVLFPAQEAITQPRVAVCTWNQPQHSGSRSVSAPAHRVGLGGREESTAEGGRLLSPQQHLPPERAESPNLITAFPTSS